MNTPTDLFQDVTNSIIAQLESGVAPWIKPWSGDAGFNGGNDIPKNHLTGKSYRGINTLILWITSVSVGYSSGHWITYKQAQQIGAQVRKGEKGTRIAVYKPWSIKDVNSSGEENTKIIPVLRSYTVFNIAQCDGITQIISTETREPVEIRHQAADALLSQANIDHGGDSAFYSPSADRIRLPAQAAFNDPMDYYATALHELTHWSGHKTRCARDFAKKYGTEAYAREELVAELGAAFLCSSLGITGKLQHAEYIGNWIQVLKNDKKAIFKAASAAQKAFDFITKSKYTEEEQDQIAA